MKLGIERFFIGKDLPVILQTEAAECGLASIAMVAGYHGYNCDLASLRRRFSTSLMGMTFSSMTKVADDLKLSSRALRLEIDEISRLQVPCILHWRLNHFVVLAEVKRNYVVLHDPSKGRLRMSMGGVSESFTGMALELNPTEDFKRAELRQELPLRRLLTGMSGLKRSLVQIFILAFVLELIALVMPLFTQWIIDGVLLSGDQDLLQLLVIGFLFVLLTQITISGLRAWAVLYLSTQIGIKWVTRVFSHLIRLPLSYFERRFVGDISSRFHGVATIQQTLTSYFIEALLDGLLAVGTLIVMFLYSSLLATIAIGGLLIYGALRWVWYGYLRRISEKQLVVGARQDSHFLETLRGIQAIKLFQRQTERRSTWLNYLIEQTNTSVQQEKVGIGYRAANSLITGLEQALVLWIGATLVLNSTFSVGMYMAFSSYSAQFTRRIVSLIDKFVSLRMLRLQTERLADIVYTEPEAEGDISIEKGEGGLSVEFRDVSFRYSSDQPWVFENLSFFIDQGEAVALIGPSGCGKTTILKLLTGIFEPERGDILIGGVSLRKLGPRGARSLCGCVMQNDQLFAGSLEENIAFFDFDLDRNWIQICAKQAAIHDAIVSMPMGYHTLAGDMGNTLSGGQRQRVLLARALYKKPAVLLLDEATSSLDASLEAQICASVSKLGMTRIIVAHRRETIAMADRIIKINNSL